MLTALVGAALRLRGAVVGLAVLALCYGVLSLGQAEYDVFPEFAAPLVEIQTEAPGLAPEQIEVLVTQPIESAVNGVAGIDALRSTSIQGVSVVTVAFDPRSDVFRDRQVIAERLTALGGSLPQGVSPVMTPLTSSTGDLMTVGLTAEHLSLMELRTLAQWVIQRRLLAVPGVAKVAIFGGDVKQLQVQVEPERLLQHGLALDDVIAAARRASGMLGAGFLDTGNQRLVLRTDQALDAQALAATVLSRDGTFLTLGDVAEVAAAPAPAISSATVMGQPAVILNIWAQYGANTLAVTEEVERALDELGPAVAAQNVKLWPDLFRPATFIQLAVHNVQASLLTGALLVVLVLLLFLLDLRAAAISCTAIPLSLLAAVTLLQYFGHSLNTMTLGGLAMAIGEVVDDAVIGVENVLRRLRENARLAEPRPALRVVLDASVEVRGAVVYATFAVALVFVPILTMSGLAGRLFAPLGVAYILATLASLLVALTVTPALCLMLFGRRRLRPQPPFVVRGLRAAYAHVLRRVERMPGTVVTLAALGTACGLATLWFVGGEFLPDLRESHFLLHVNALPGTSLEQSERLGKSITTELQKLPAVRAVAQRIGRAASDDTFGTHSSEFEVDLKPEQGADAHDVEGQIRAALDGFPGITFSVNTFLRERVEETVSGFAAAVVFRVFGEDLDVIDQKAAEVEAALSGVPGAADVQRSSALPDPELTVRLRPRALQRFQLDAVGVLEAVRAAFQGQVVGQTWEADRTFDVAVILGPRARRSVAQLAALPLRNGAGEFVPLGEVGEIQQASGRYAIAHEAARRVETVTCNVAGRDIESFVNEATRRIRAAVAFPAGSFFDVTGEFAEQQRAQRDLLVHSALAGIGIILLLSIVMRSLPNLLLVMLNLPMALVGGVLAVYATGGSLSMGALVGFVTLFGITLRNSIMMIAHFEHLVSREGQPWNVDTAIRGASERLVPILMTALVTGLGLLPLALGSSEAGREIEGPMAIVILGGLLTSTALNLLVLPTLALRLGRFGGPVDVLDVPSRP